MNTLRSLTAMSPPLGRPKAKVEAARAAATKPHDVDLAHRLNSLAPPGHKLAYINEREEALLRAHGGSGATDHATGVQRFDDPLDEFGGGIIGEGGGGAPPPLPTAGGADPFFTTGAGGGAGAGYNFAAPDFSGGAAMAPAAPQTPPDAFGGGGAPDVSSFAPAGSSDPFFTTGAGGASGAPGFDVPPTNYTAPQTPDAGTDQQKPGGGLTKGLDLGRLAVGGISALLGAKTARNAAAQGQAAKTQEQQIAAPYQSTGQQLQAQAQRGELTPSGQQAIQAMRAQLAQGAANRGGVGAAQAENQIAALRQKLLDQQYQLGLQISGIGDQIALGAIKTGIQADQYVNNLTSTYFNNVARTIYGGAPAPAPAPGPG